MKISNCASSISPSPTLSLNELAKSLRAQGKPVINLGVGEPTNLTPIPAVEKSKARLDTRSIKYTPSGGNPDLKQAILEYTELHYKCRPTLKNVLVTVGAKQALFNTLVSIVNPGESVILLAPYWVSYPEMVKIVCGKPVIVMPEPDTLIPSLESIQQSVTSKTRAIILNSPNNPSGVVYPQELVASITAYCEERHIYLIMDDIYHQLVYGETPWIPGYNYTKLPLDSSHLVVINGVSKTYGMTGFRIGWAVASTDLIQVMTNIQSQTTSGASIVTQDAALGALTGSQFVVSSLRETIKENRDIAVGELIKFNRVNMVEPEGAFYCLPDFSSYKSNSQDLSKQILENAHVAVVPGSAFGMEGHLRISFAGDAGEIQEGIQRIKKLLD